jgi:pilus assembly protein Flp/PilA
MRVFHRSSDERGATAVEYGLIAGLIALGIIGSLVATKTSLQSTFSGISGQMGTASGGGSATSGVTSQRAIAAANSSSRYPYWSAKTLASKVVTNPTANSQLTTFSYTDGSSGSYLAQFSNTGALTGEIVTTYPWGDQGRTMDSVQMTYGADGSQQALVYTDRYANGTTRQIVTGFAPNFSNETIKNYDTNGNLSSTQAYTDSGIGTALTKLQGDEVYFRALANQ